MEKKEIFTELEDRNQFLDVIKANNSLLIIKFSATWCRPCRKIHQHVLNHFAKLPENVVCGDLDVDDNFDVFAYLKSKKMVKGVPIILCYKAENDSFIPDDSIDGSDIKQIDAFFARCHGYIKID
jgi:thiol-disulfide isomerase/thioredoxin